MNPGASEQDPRPGPMSDQEIGDRNDQGKAIWWPTHEVWVRQGRWFTGDRHHRHRHGAGYIQGLPAVDVDDTDRAAADQAEAQIAQALSAGTVERGAPAPQRLHPRVWTASYFRTVLEARRV